MLNFKRGTRLLFLLSLAALAMLALAGCSDDETTGPADSGSIGSVSGLITIRCTPEDLNIPWTLATPDGTLVRGENSQVLEGMPEGQYQLAWGEVGGWRSPHPDPDVQILTSDGNLDFPGTYQLEPGSLYIKVLPSGMRPQWTLVDDEDTVLATGYPDTTVTDLVTGHYRLSWEELPHVTANTLDVDLTGSEHGQTIYGSYSPERRYLLLVPSPSGVPAPWTVTNTAGASFSGTGTDSIRLEGPAEVGAVFYDYTIIWGEVDGFTSPAQTEFLIQRADTNRSYLVAPDYVADPVELDGGTVTVTGTIGSSDVNWELVGPDGYVLTGAGNQTLTNMPVGSYTMNWLATDGWSVPAPDTADLAASGGIAFTAHNDPAISIKVLPEGLAGRWELSGPGGYSASGVGSDFLEPEATGSYTLTWLEVTGWTTPAAQTVSLSQTQGQVLSGTYTRVEGNAFVQTYPEGLAAGWTLTGPEGFSYSGTGQEALQLTSAGSYRIQFAGAEGYIKPASRYLTIDPAATTTIDGTYLPAVSFVTVSSAIYNMGSVNTEPCRGVDEDRHSVFLSNNFSIMATEVTNEFYVALANWALAHDYAVIENGYLWDNMDSSTAMLLDMSDGDHEVFARDGKLVCINPQHPLKEVTWYGAAAFCDWFSLHQGKPRAYDRQNWYCNGFQPVFAAGYRLPIEAEWEMAARSGSGAAFANGTLSGASAYCTSVALGNIGWWSGNSDFMTHEVGTLAPNDWGIFDMHGNVAEWCNDWYDSAYYRRYISRTITNPRGPYTGDTKVVRGGYFYSTVEGCRSSARDFMSPATASFRTGFRMVIRGGGE